MFGMNFKNRNALKTLVSLNIKMKLKSSKFTGVNEMIRDNAEMKIIEKSNLFHPDKKNPLKESCLIFRIISRMNALVKAMSKMNNKDLIEIGNPSKL